MRQPLLLVLMGTLVFIAVVLYRRPAGSISAGLLRMVHPSTLGYAANEALASAAPAVGTRAGFTRTSAGGSDVNPFAPAAVGDGRLAASGLGIGIGSAGTAAGAPPGSEQNHTAAEAAGASAGSGGVAPAPSVTPAQAANQMAKVAHGLSAADGGVRVDQVLPGSVAGRLGLQTGDVIVSVNGAPVDSPAQFAQIYEKDGLPRQVSALRGGQLILSNP